MEQLVSEGLFTGVLDITTTEWADEICGGILSAGPERLDAPGRAGVAHVICPGAVDMVNFCAPGDRARSLQRCRPSLLPVEPGRHVDAHQCRQNRRLGEVLAQKANAARGPVAFIFPLRGVSILDADGGPFCDLRRRSCDAAGDQGACAGRHRRP